jgi:hypothetical protein
MCPEGAVQDRQIHTGAIAEEVIVMGFVERAEALFLSDLQPSQRLTPDQVAEAVEVELHRSTQTARAAAVAAEYGEHPDTAPVRMRWALGVLATQAITRKLPIAA